MKRRLYQTGSTLALIGAAVLPKGAVPELVQGFLIGAALVTLVYSSMMEVPGR